MNRVVFLFTDEELSDTDMPFGALIDSKISADEYTIEPAVDGVLRAVHTDTDPTPIRPLDWDEI